MSLNDLAAVVAPPAVPLDSGSDMLWREIQGGLGVELPPDLFDYVKAYGTGCFCDGEIKILNPFWEYYRHIFDNELSIVAEIKQNEPADVPFGIYPDKPGLVPWGYDDNANQAFWLTEGNASQWPILLKDQDCKWERWDGLSMTTFLARAFTKSIKCLFWGDIDADQMNFRTGIRYRPRTT